MAIVVKGAERSVVEKELGEPVAVKDKGSGEAVLYTYKIGDKPAVGRAFLYLLGDIVTLFYAEYLFTPLEASNSGQAHDLIVDYDASGKVLGMRVPTEASAEEQL